MLKIFVALLLVACFQGTAMAQTEERESNLKAAFIYNFTRYIEWEPSMEQNQFVIGVIGPTTVINPLREIADQNFVKNKRISIKYFSRPEDIDYCNILFISRHSSFQLPSILTKINKGTVTISEQAGFAKEGTAFNFVVINDKLKFEANLRAITAAGVKAGSQLLKLAIIVEKQNEH